ncbi:MAG: prepilin-type N-terminal cleavage/methylation domain-containing protein [Desulfobacteraceae bacterium]|nr:prepilin-type N-terminal cleavage/methylation domain-containing protein [Desulfobacteraceae bacterium]
MYLYLSSKKGFTLIELIIVNCIISILTAVAMLAFFSQKEKAYSIILLHDLNTLSKALTVYQTEKDDFPFLKGDIIGEKNKIACLSKGVKIEITEIDSENPFGNHPFIVKASLNKKTISFDLNKNMVVNMSDNKSFNDFIIVKFLKYFLYILVLSLLFVSAIIFILKIGSRKK